MEALAKVAYEAYCAHTGWKSLVSGATLPQWVDVKPEIKAAWEAVVNKLIEVSSRENTL